MSDLTPGRPDLAIATVLGADTSTPTWVYVDLSHAESSNRLVVAFTDCEGVPVIGDVVTAVDTAAQKQAEAAVVGIDERDRVIRIAVDWTTLRSVRD